MARTPWRQSDPRRFRLRRERDGQVTAVGSVFPDDGPAVIRFVSDDPVLRATITYDRGIAAVARLHQDGHRIEWIDRADDT